MPNNEKDYHVELCRVAKGIAESISDMSKEDIVNEFREDGCNLRTEAIGVKNLMLQTIKKYRREKLKEEYIHQVTKINNSNHNIPDTVEERKHVFMEIMFQQPDLWNSLTLQHRDFNQFTDSDIENILKQLQELGIKINL